MGHPAGLRAGTRYAFSRNFREKGMIRLSTYLRQFKYVFPDREPVTETPLPTD